MIKQSFLNSLKGLELALAHELCHLKGHQTEEVFYRHAITLQARPNTVILFFNDKEIVTGTMAGDGLDLEED
jgi:hypothetical protein